LARHWLPEFFKDVRIDPRTLHVHREHRAGEPPGEWVALDAALAAPAPPPERTARGEEEALACLADAKPRRRARGLGILADLEEPDLFDWCAMFLEDPSPTVRVAALRAMLRCDEADPQVVVPLARSPHKSTRAAAIAALARHSGPDAACWFERGLKDPSPCVRVETAAVLEQLDPAEHHAIFELALYDSNSNIVRLAEKLIAGKGYAKLTW